MELLCPAGSFDALTAVVENGADAVYFGGGAFNARREAKSPEDLKEAVDYCHIRGCKVYFTLNTLILDREFKAFLELAYKAAKCGVDAFIAQDLGAGCALKKEFPEIPLHASTQMTVTNSYAARWLEEIGYERIILARELTKREIKAIHNKVNIPLEAFAHGALCEGYSGQCLFSSFLGGRSANRGECAQPCRLKYEIGNKSGHLLSAKDLCLIDYIKELKNCGVSSLKIEGRLKRAEYAAQVARVYRRAIDGEEISEEDRGNLKAVFNRGDFTSGKFGGDKRRLYISNSGHIGLPLGRITRVYRNKNGETVEIDTLRKVSAGDMVIGADGSAKPVSVKRAEQSESGCKLTFDGKTGFKKGDDLRLVYIKNLMESLSPERQKGKRKMPLAALVRIEAGEKAKLIISGKEGRTAEVFGQIVQQAENKAVTQEEIVSQISKTGGTPFYFENIEVDLKDGAAYPKSALNELRRSGLNSYAEMLTRPREVKPPDFGLINELKSKFHRKAVKAKLSAYVATLAQARAVEEIVDILYIPVKYADVDFADKKVIPALPPVCSDKYIKAALPIINEFKSVLTTCPFSFDGKKIADYTFNITNLFSLKVLSDSGYSRGVLSPELTAPQVRDLTRHSPIETEATVYGKINLMITANCPVDCAGKNCKIETEEVFLKDRMGKKFLLRKAGEGCSVAILNSVPVYMADKINDVYADVMRLVFTDEPPELCAGIARHYKNALNGEKIETPQSGEFTRGHYYRGFNKYE